MIDLTKQYKTRGGRAVRILCTDGPARDYPVVGYIGNSIDTSSWSSLGKWILDKSGDDFDLIEVKPKIVVKQWGVVYQYKNSSDIHVEFHLTEQDAHQPYADYVTVLARAVPFKWEGEG